jgi:hydroxymethylbilane synthase
MDKKKLRIGARGSKLSLLQVEYIINLLQSNYPNLAFEVNIIKSLGDKLSETPISVLGGQGIFVKEIENAVRNDEIDIAIHCLKDLTVKNSDLILGAITKREMVNDCLISKEGICFKELKPNSIIGTSSPRRAAQLLAMRGDIVIKPIRGNIDTRITKVKHGEYDAITLACAGIRRLNITSEITEIFELSQILPAPGQGALAVQCKNIPEIINVLKTIDDFETRITTTAERAFLQALGAGCSMPVSAYGEYINNELALKGKVSKTNSKEHIEVTKSISLNKVNEKTAIELGEAVAREALSKGAKKYL